jgi:O-acetyl-ADP-ribose deacetylase (regulator of RNase III)
VIRVEVGDITSMDVDAVVRPATATLAGIDRPEDGPSGPYSVRQPLDVGAAVVTAATALTAEFVIHAVLKAPGRDISGDGVRLALVSVMHQARAWRLSRIAVPLLGVGPDGIAKEEAASLLAEVLSTEGRTAPDPSEVCIVVGSDEDRSLVEAHLRRWLAYES